MTPDRKLTQLDQQKRGLQDDHDSDLGQKQADRRGGVHSKSGKKKGQGIVRDERGQDQPADKKRAQQSIGSPQVSQVGQSSGYSSNGGKSSEKKTNHDGGKDDMGSHSVTRIWQTRSPDYYTR
jgi:hypothetical protein